MIVATSVGGVNLGDIIFTLVSFLFLIFIVVGIISLFVMLSRKNKQLNRIEEKLDRMNKTKKNQG
ncbi:ATP synthase subunit B family protein [Aquibacillus rhizosphaerae]|uniref:DUF4083 domain-containing protein n=1 Tax=Aquibacillus rhizosphaerae TaxID=3051431 RepID=A0ABT7L3S4_9BACI|nr:hypothetical protein [Aquibacillus sp. LR5S19]MDL4839825.1 hypothetical protein [Aquibacillus sp. LR5S19]